MIRLSTPISLAGLVYAACLVGNKREYALMEIIIEIVSNNWNGVALFSHV
jgi:hypothetical protein